MSVHELSQAAQGILDEITEYHRGRLFVFQQAASGRKRLDDRRGHASIARAIEQMMSDAGLEGAEYEWSKETSRLAPAPLGNDRHRLWIPLSALTRDLNVASAGAAGYLVEAAVQPARDLLRPWSFTLQAGVQTAESMVAAAMVPVCDADTVITWVSTETTEATPSQPGFKDAALVPHTAIGLIQCSRNFMRQADPEAWIRRHLLRAAGMVIDQAVLNGTGASGQPLGILNAPGISTQSGASLAWAGVLAMKKNAALANAATADISFIATPGVRELLEARECATGSGFIWASERIAACPAFATTDMPAASMLSGPMTQVFFGLWGAGMQVEVNPYEPSLFKSGAVQIRVVVTCDVALVCDRSAFTTATAIT